MKGACSVWRFPNAGDGLSCFTTRARGLALALCPRCYRFTQEHRDGFGERLNTPAQTRRMRPIR